MTPTFTDLAAFGWSQHFQSQLTPDDARLVPARVTVVHRNRLDVVAPGFEARATFKSTEDENHPTVGDWVLIDPATLGVVRMLDRISLFKRKAAGTANRLQLLAANVDTVLIVSSCNHDFNPARIERYLALARDAAVEPVVILTKADMTDDLAGYAAQARAIAPGLLVETVDARDPLVVERLRPWLRSGHTIALMGSSGVGKSTIINTLLGEQRAATAPVREDDSRGRHTTVGRSLHRLGTGAWLVDTPGMREVQLTDAEAGIEDLFDDVVALQQNCRFNNCSHTTEPGCAVQAALADGTLEPDRLARFEKLRREDALNTATLAQRRAKEKTFGKMAKAVLEGKSKRRDW